MSFDFPYYQHNVNAWLGSRFVRKLPLAARGLYADLLSYSWRAWGIDPSDIDSPGLLAGELGITSREFRVNWKRISCKFELGPNGKLVNPEQEEVRLEVIEKNQKQTNKALKRWELFKAQHAAASAVADPTAVPQVCQETEETKETEETEDKPKQKTLVLTHSGPVSSPFEGKAKNAIQRKRVEQFGAIGLKVLAFLNTERKRVAPATRHYPPNYEHLDSICRRLELGASIEDCMHVISVAAGEVAAGGDSKWFNYDTPFAANWARYFSGTTTPAPRSQGFNRNGIPNITRAAPPNSADVLADAYGDVK